MALNGITANWIFIWIWMLCIKVLVKCVSLCCGIELSQAQQSLRPRIFAIDSSSIKTWLCAGIFCNNKLCQCREDSPYKGPVMWKVFSSSARLSTGTVIIKFRPPNMYITLQGLMLLWQQGIVDLLCVIKVQLLSQWGAINSALGAVKGCKSNEALLLIFIFACWLQSWHPGVCCNVGYPSEMHL